MSDLADTHDSATPHKAGVFDLRTIIGALMAVYGVILTLAGLLVEHEPESTPAGIPPAYWPASGDLEVKNLSARYSSVSSCGSTTRVPRSHPLRYRMDPKYCTTFLSRLPPESASVLVRKSILQSRALLIRRLHSWPHG